jgi:hypothetical protein
MKRVMTLDGDLGTSRGPRLVTPLGRTSSGVERLVTLHPVLQLSILATRIFSYPV